ncbi:unnamed protein product [Dicrocoelium dendriticum]|nr:unnamed protein product [Dicrocoelium dendriticum]
MKSHHLSPASRQRHPAPKTYSFGKHRPTATDMLHKSTVHSGERVALLDRGIQNGAVLHHGVCPRSTIAPTIPSPCVLATPQRTAQLNAERSELESVMGLEYHASYFDTIGQLEPKQLVAVASLLCTDLYMPAVAPCLQRDGDFPTRDFPLSSIRLFRVHMVHSCDLAQFCLQDQPQFVEHQLISSCAVERGHKLVSGALETVYWGLSGTEEIKSAYLGKHTSTQQTFSTNHSLERKPRNCAVSLCLMSNIHGEDRPDFRKRLIQTHFIRDPDVRIMGLIEQVNWISVSTKNPLRRLHRAKRRHISMPLHHYIGLHAQSRPGSSVVLKYPNRTRLQLARANLCGSSNNALSIQSTPFLPRFHRVEYRQQRPMAIVPSSIAYQRNILKSTTLKHYCTDTLTHFSPPFLNNCNHVLHTGTNSNCSRSLCVWSNPCCCGSAKTKTTRIQKALNKSDRWWACLSKRKTACCCSHVNWINSVSRIGYEACHTNCLRGVRRRKRHRSRICPCLLKARKHCPWLLSEPQMVVLGLPLYIELTPACTCWCKSEQDFMGPDTLAASETPVLPDGPAENNSSVFRPPYFVPRGSSEPVAYIKTEGFTAERDHFGSRSQAGTSGILESRRVETDIPTTLKTGNIEYHSIFMRPRRNISPYALTRRNMCRSGMCASYTNVPCITNNGYSCFDDLANTSRIGKVVTLLTSWKFRGEIPGPTCWKNIDNDTDPEVSSSSCSSASKMESSYFPFLMPAYWANTGKVAHTYDELEGSYIVPTKATSRRHTEGIFLAVSSTAKMSGISQLKVARTQPRLLLHSLHHSVEWCKGPYEIQEEITPSYFIHVATSESFLTEVTQPSVLEPGVDMKSSVQYHRMAKHAGLSSKIRSVSCWQTDHFTLHQSLTSTIQRPSKRNFSVTSTKIEITPTISVNTYKPLCGEVLSNQVRSISPLRTQSPLHNRASQLNQISARRCMCSFGSSCKAGFSTNDSHPTSPEVGTELSSPTTITEVDDDGWSLTGDLLHEGECSEEKFELIPITASSVDDFWSGYLAESFGTPTTSLTDACVHSNSYIHECAPEVTCTVSSGMDSVPSRPTTGTSTIPAFSNVYRPTDGLPVFQMAYGGELRLFRTNYSTPSPSLVSDVSLTCFSATSLPLRTPGACLTKTSNHIIPPGGIIPSPPLISMNECEVLVTVDASGYLGNQPPLTGSQCGPAAMSPDLALAGLKVEQSNEKRLAGPELKMRIKNSQRLPPADQPFDAHVGMVSDSARADQGGCNLCTCEESRTFNVRVDAPLFLLVGTNNSNSETVEDDVWNAQLASSILATSLDTDFDLESFQSTITGDTNSMGTLHHLTKGTNRYGNICEPHVVMANCETSSPSGGSLFRTKTKVINYVTNSVLLDESSCSIRFHDFELLNSRAHECVASICQIRTKSVPCMHNNICQLSAAVRASSAYPTMISAEWPRNNEAEDTEMAACNTDADCSSPETEYISCESLTEQTILAGTYHSTVDPQKLFQQIEPQTVRIAEVTVGKVAEWNWLHDSADPLPCFSRSDTLDAISIDVPETTDHRTSVVLTYVSLTHSVQAASCFLTESPALLVTRIPLTGHLLLITCAPLNPIIRPFPSFCTTQRHRVVISNCFQDNQNFCATLLEHNHACERTSGLYVSLQKSNYISSPAGRALIYIPPAYLIVATCIEHIQPDQVRSVAFGEELRCTVQDFHNPYPQIGYRLQPNFGISTTVIRMVFNEAALALHAAERRFLDCGSLCCRSLCTQFEITEVLTIYVFQRLSPVHRSRCSWFRQKNNTCTHSFLHRKPVYANVVGRLREEESKNPASRAKPTRIHRYCMPSVYNEQRCAHKRISAGRKKLREPQRRESVPRNAEPHVKRSYAMWQRPTNAHNKTHSELTRAVRTHRQRTFKCEETLDTCTSECFFDAVDRTHIDKPFREDSGDEVINSPAYLLRIRSSGQSAPSMCTCNSVVTNTICCS